MNNLNPNWHGGGHFYPLVLFGLDFVMTSMGLFDTLPRSLRLIKKPLGGAKDEHFLAFIPHANEG